MITIVRAIIIGILLAVTLLLVSVQLVQYNTSWYATEFKLLKITPPIGQVQNLFGYLQGQEDLNNQFYTEREVLHLHDVKQLLQQEKIVTMSWYLFFILLLVVLLVVQRPTKLIETIFYSTLAVLVMYGVIGILFYFNFDWLFLHFHFISFSNDYWQLDPASDHLVTIFPPQLFFDLVKQIIAVALLWTVALGATTGVVTMAFRTKS